MEEFTGWLTVNNAGIVRVEKPRKKKNQLSGYCKILSKREAS